MTTVPLTAVAGTPTGCEKEKYISEHGVSRHVGRSKEYDADPGTSGPMSISLGVPVASRTPTKNRSEVSPEVRSKSAVNRKDPRTRIGFAGCAGCSCAAIDALLDPAHAGSHAATALSRDASTARRPPV